MKFTKTQNFPKTQMKTFSKQRRSKQVTNLKFHPSKKVPSLPPPLLLFQNHTHLSITQLPNKRTHHLSHIILTLSSLSQGPHVTYRRHHVATVEVTVPVVLKVLNHLLGSPLDPLGCLCAWALVLAELAEVLSLGLDDAASVVVGEWVLGVLGPGFGLVWVVAVAEGPWVRGDWRGWVDGGFGFCWGWFSRREEWDCGEEGGLEVEVQGLHSCCCWFPFRILVVVKTST